MVSSVHFNNVMRCQPYEKKAIGQTLRVKKKIDFCVISENVCSALILKWSVLDKQYRLYKYGGVV